MVAARRAVLDGGLFAPVAEVVEALAVELVRGGSDTCARLALDAGCGEGWYTDRLRRALGPHGLGTLGIDVSKPAVSAAARRYRETGFAVATNRVPPVLAGRAALVTSLFGFETWRPWADLQEPGQHVLTAGAGPDHLVELRRLVYGDVRVREGARDGAPERAGYALVAERRVREARKARPGLARAALAMTPHAHRVPAARGAAVAEGIDRVGGLTLDVALRAWRRSG